MTSDTTSFCSVSDEDKSQHFSYDIPRNTTSQKNQFKYLNRPEFNRANKNSGYEKKKPQRYAYFPNLANRTTGDLKINDIPNGGQTITQDWQLEMSENQRLRMVLRSLGKAAEKYIASVLHENDYKNKSKKFHLLDNNDKTKQKNLAPLSNVITSIFPHQRPYYIVQEITDKEPLRHSAIENCLKVKEQSNKEEKIIPNNEHFETNEIDDFETLLDTVKNGDLKPLLHEYMKLKIEKQRLQRRLGFLMEDISIESKKRGFSRPNQYLHHLPA